MEGDREGIEVAGSASHWTSMSGSGNIDFAMEYPQ